MIPREILKKIRQIEIRTNRLVSETRADFSFQPSAQFGRVSFAMPNRNDHHFLGLEIDREIDRVRPTQDFCFRCQPAGAWKSFRVIANFAENLSDFTGKSLPHARLSFVIKVNPLRQFPFSLLFDDDPKRHCTARNRFSMSAIASSNGRQRSGCPRACSARRSSSAICSGVSSSSCSPNSAQIRSATSRRSFSGSRRICSRISVALMALDYPGRNCTQETIRPRRSAGCVQEAGKQERGQPCPREFGLKPGTRGHGSPRSNLERTLRRSGSRLQAPRSASAMGSLNAELQTAVAARRVTRIMHYGVRTAL